MKIARTIKKTPQTVKFIGIAMKGTTQSLRPANMLRTLLIGAILLSSFATIKLVEAGDKGDDIILAKGKIIMRGGKGKGNIILDPGSHSSEDSGHGMSPMMFNPYAFYPMHVHHQEPHHQPPMMIKPIYIEDHSALNHHQGEEHHEHQHHEEPQHHYEHHEPQHHYEHNDMGHHQQHHYEPEHQHEPMHEQHHYEHESSEHHDASGGEEGHHGGGYEHHPLMAAMMMHGSGSHPAYQQFQSLQHQQQMYSHLNPEQQAANYHQAQLHAAIAEQQARQQHLDQGSQSQLQSGEVAQAPVSVASRPSDSSSSTPSKPPSKAKLLLEKSANNPIVQMIKPLFTRNKDNKDSSSLSVTNPQKQ